MIELLIGAAGAALLAPVTFFVGRYVRPTPPEPELCTGYIEKSSHDLKQRHDCKALRSVLCSDGRCSFHCATMCKCEGASP